jgi:hypothetical protein
MTAWKPGILFMKIKEQPYPDWVCLTCGQEHGKGMPEGHVATWHLDICGICGLHTEVTEPRDFKHMKKWPL